MTPQGSITRGFHPSILQTFNSPTKPQPKSNIMELSTHALDDITDIQHNLDASELEGAIDKLSAEQLVVLRRDCLASGARQIGIATRVERIMRAQGIAF
jgi:hypothetical protein